VPQGVEALVGFFLPFVGEVEGDHRGCELGVPQGAWDETRMDASFKEMGGVGMAQRRHGHTGFGDPGPVCGGTAGALDPGAAHGGGGGRTELVSASGGGEEPGGGRWVCQEVRRSVRVSTGRGTYRSLAPWPRWPWTWRRRPSMSEP
jgi:hypothetical protein